MFSRKKYFHFFPAFLLSAALILAFSAFSNFFERLNLSFSAINFLCNSFSLAFFSAFSFSHLSFSAFLLSSFCAFCSFASATFFCFRTALLALFVAVSGFFWRTSLRARALATFPGIYLLPAAAYWALMLLTKPRTCVSSRVGIYSICTTPSNTAHPEKMICKYSIQGI